MRIKSTTRKQRRPVTSRNGTLGQSFRLPPVTGVWKKSIRGILGDLVSTHSTEIAMRLRDGMLSPKLTVALKYLGMAAAYVDGKPVETHRMVGLNDGPTGAYDLSKLSAAKKKELLALLRSAKDTTTPKGKV